MDLLCPHIGGAKAFKGKGEVLRLARQAGVCLAEILGQMRQLARASKDAQAGGSPYLEMERRRTRQGHTCRLRWRNALHRHVRWADVEHEVKRLPIGLHDAYRQMNRRACELNVLYGLHYEARKTLARLARVYGSAEDESRDSPVERCPGEEQHQATRTS